MLLAHDATGAVIFQLGAISTMPDGPPDESLPALFAEAGVQPAGWVRVNDNDDPGTVAAVLARGAKITRGRVELLPEPPAAPAPEPPVDPVAALQAQVDALTALVLGGSLL